MQAPHVSDIKYIVLPGRFCESSYLPLYNKAFDFWKQNWTDVFKQLGTSKVPSADDFFRQDFIPVILHQDRIVAIHLYTLYDMRTDRTLGHSYLAHNFTPEYFSILKGKGLEKVMSMESLFIDPAYRKSLVGVQFAEVLICLGQRLFEQYTDAEAIIAPARQDVKVSVIAQPIGFKIIQPDITLNNVPVDLVLCRRGEPAHSPNELTRFYTEALWRKLEFALPAQSVTKAA